MRRIRVKDDVHRGGLPWRAVQNSEHEDLRGCETLASKRSTLQRYRSIPPLYPCRLRNRPRDRDPVRSILLRRPGCSAAARCPCAGPTQHHPPAHSPVWPAVLLDEEGEEGAGERLDDGGQGDGQQHVDGHGETGGEGEGAHHSCRATWIDPAERRGCRPIL